MRAAVEAVANEREASLRSRELELPITYGHDGEKLDKLLSARQDVLGNEGAGITLNPITRRGQA